MALLTTLAVGGIAGYLFGRRKAMGESHRRLRQALIDRARQRAAERATGRSVTLSGAEKEALLQQYAAGGALVSFALGRMIHPLLALPGLPLLGYGIVHLLRQIWASYRRKGRLAVLIFEVFSVVVALVFGSLLLASILLLLIASAQRLIAKTEREALTDFSSIFGELASTAWLLRDGAEVEVPLNTLQIDDVIVLRAGEMIPVDGEILAGEGLVDQHLLTGESQPAEKGPGDGVLTSTLLISGTLRVRVQRKGDETITGQIARTLEHAARFKLQAQARGERIVDKGATRTMAASLLAVPLLGVQQAMALVFSGFGYQMRMAAPLTVLNYLRIASRHGVLVKDGRALDKLVQVDTVVFDKTGTLTEEVPQVAAVRACNGYRTEQLLFYAASAEQRQKHPIAQAICRHARDRGLELLEPGDSHYSIGHGLRVELDDPARSDGTRQTVIIGSRRFVDSNAIPVPVDIEALQAAAGEQGHSLVYVADGDGRLMGALELRPTIRPQARAAVQALKRAGMTLYIISGDQEHPTRSLAQSLGIDHYFAETLPANKAGIVQSLQEQGHKVCFIGDGINDSVALQQADVSVSLHGAATIAQDAAEIVLMDPDLNHLPFLLQLARDLDQRMDRGEWLNNAAGVVCVSGVVVLGIGMSGAMLIYGSGFVSSLANAIGPLLDPPVPATGRPGRARNR